jgi:hypothetical protein
MATSKPKALNQAAAVFVYLQSNRLICCLHRDFSHDEVKKPWKRSRLLFMVKMSFICSMIRALRCFAFRVAFETTTSENVTYDDFEAG